MLGVVNYTISFENFSPLFYFRGQLACVKVALILIYLFKIPSHLHLIILDHFKN